MQGTRRRYRRLLGTELYDAWLIEWSPSSGLELHDQGRCPEALPIFEQVTREFPEDWYAWAGLGDCYVEQNDLIKGEDSLHRAVDISHDPALTAHWQELRLHMGLSKSDQGK